MTLPEVPEWRTRVHLTTEKSSGNKCTQRVGIRVPEESTYAPSIRKMISPPSDFTAKAQSQRQRQHTKRSPNRGKASRNMKLVEARSIWKHQAGQWPSESNSKAKASGKMRREQVQKWDKASWPRPAKRQAKLKTSEVQRRRLPKDASVNKGHQKSTEVHKSTELRWQSTTDLSLSHWRSNENQKGVWPCQKCVLLISRKPTWRQSTETHWEFDQEAYWVVDQSSPTGKPKAQLDEVNWEVDRRSLPSQPRSYWSRLSKVQPEGDRKVYPVDQDSIEASFREHNHEVDRMVTEADFQRPLPSQPVSGSQCHFPITTAWDIFDEVLHEGSREHRHALIW